ncbi:MAG: 1-acyl-sn-glycerol-3-phosphate acyltransferase [Bacteroidales bacterium]|jgi:1-acyl-sn-glycerol-3-phosphate acyltransferase|nr:1-acyl-sn-glycerol-3-phosphate acyltransferase [Bacteroidales bacterium]
MGKKLAKFVLKCRKWNYNEFPDIDKAVVLMAPHTSMMDFVYGKIYFIAHGKKPTILIKKEIFFWPMGPILRKLGAIPVDRGKRTGITDMAVETFKNKEGRFYLVITPEGTRKKTKNWKKGFIRIAKAANVPVICGFIDFKTRSMGVMEPLDMSGTDEEIMERVKRRYVGFEGVHPENFATGYE